MLECGPRSRSLLARAHEHSALCADVVEDHDHVAEAKSGAVVEGKAADALPLEPRAVGAALIHEQKSLICPDDPGVVPRDFLGFDHHLVVRAAPDPGPGLWDLVPSSVGGSTANCFDCQMRHAVGSNAS